MMRKLIGTLPWMVLTTAAYGQVRSADVLYTHFSDVPSHAYRVGDECFVPIEELSRFGWDVRRSADLAKVKAEGVEFTVATRQFNGQDAVPFRVAITKAGGMSDWVMNTDTLEVYSELTSISANNGKIRFFAPLEAKPRTFYLSNPSRFVVDIEGARIGAKTVEDLGPGARVTQFRANVARLVVETPNLPEEPAAVREPTHLFELELNPTKASQGRVTSASRGDSSNDSGDPGPPPPIKDPEESGTGDTSPGGQNLGQNQAQNPTGIQGNPLSTRNLQINLDQETASSAYLSVPLPAIQGQVHVHKPQPDVLEITIPGLYLTLPDGFKIPTESINNATVKTVSDGTLLTLYLARPMGAQVWSDQTTVRIQLLKPNVGSGRLGDKVIVVDPGHGGHDNGAHDGGLNEKDLTLSISKLIANRLSEAGATVIMTRKSDVFIPLETRAQIANDNNADLFVSCHINSTGGSGDQSGGITFHHLGRDMGKLLGECIQREIAKVSGLPNLGVWSDGRIYRSGFAVLRMTKMPGVLLELGFINHAADRRRMVLPEFKDAIAAAVVEGIKVFLGNAEQN